MSRRTRGLTDEEARLWERIAAGIERRPAEERPPRAVPPLRESPQWSRLATPASVQSSPIAPADRGGEKRVRRGRVEFGATLDLHGHTQVSARAALTRAISDAREHGAHAMIVVTGSGRSGEGVLRRCLPGWLAEPDLRPLVTGFAQAHRKHGGSGAYYVFLKRSGGE